jgi:DNA-binding transcriptional LysR family regulator
VLFVRRDMNAGQLPHLETFAKAAELSCFTAAGRALGLTQAAVSQQVHALEKTLGVSLFDRRGGRVLPTEAAQRLYPYAQHILSLHTEARGAVTGQKVRVTGDLLLAASSIPGEHLLPALLPAFQERYPHLRIRVTVTDSQAVLDQVDRGKAHLGLVGGKSNSAHLEFRPFACDRMVLVVPEGHPWRRRKQVSLKQLCDQPLILREPGSGSRWCLEQALARAGRSVNDLRVAVELGSNEGIKEAVLRGTGLAVLSTHAVKKELAAGKLRALTVKGLPLDRDMLVVQDRRRVLPIPARLFLDFIEPSPGAKPRS